MKKHDYIFHKFFTISVDAVVGFELAASGNDDGIQEVLDTGVLPSIVDFLEDPDSRLVKASVKAVGNILSGNDKQVCNELRGIFKKL